MYSIGDKYPIDDTYVVEIDCEESDCLDFVRHKGVIEVRGETEILSILRAKRIVKSLNKHSQEIVNKAKDKTC